MALMLVVWIKSQSALEYFSRTIILFEFNQTGSVGMQRAGLRVEQCPGTFKMCDRSSPLPLLVFEHRQHAMTDRILGSQSQHMLNEWNCSWVSCLILDLCGALQCGKIVRENLQRMAKRSQRLLAMPFSSVRCALHGP